MEMNRWAGLIAFVVVLAVVAAQDPCSAEGAEELCAFRGMLEGTLRRVNQALGSTDADVEKRKSSYVRFGRSSADLAAPEKRKSSYVRFGRSDPSGEFEEKEKRKSALVRFGRSDGVDMEKRKSSYIRFG